MTSFESSKNISYSREPRRESEPCATQAQLWLLIHDQLTAAEDSCLTDHVEHCVPCQSRLEELSRLQGDAHSPETLGPYQIGVELGRGSNGTVYLAQTAGSATPVAVKILSEHIAQTEVGRQRFLREIRVLQQLQHSGIVKIHDSGEADGKMFLVMDYVRGGTLADFSQRRPLPERTATAIILKVAEAIQYCHERQIIHRDLKPRNILLQHRRNDASSPGKTAAELDLEPMIVDFGIAKVNVETMSMTETGAMLGTLDYMAPEQLEFGQNVTSAADIYSLGAILFELLTGSPPHRATTLAEMIRFIQSEEPLRLRTIVPTASASLERICERCLQKLPSERYASCEQLAEDLRRFLGGKRPLIRPVSSLSRLRSFVRRRPGTAGVLLSIVMSFLLILISAISFAVQQNRHANATLKQRDEVQKLFDQSLLAYGMLNFDIETIVEQKGRPSQALHDQVQHIIQFMHPLVNDYPTRKDYRAILTIAYHYDARIAHEGGLANDHIIGSYESCILECRKLLESSTLDAEETKKFSLLLGNTMSFLGNFYRQVRNWKDADKAHMNAVQFFQSASKASPGDEDYTASLALATQNWAGSDILKAQLTTPSAVNFAEVQQRIDSAAADWESVFASDPTRGVLDIDKFATCLSFDVELAWQSHDEQKIRTAIRRLVTSCPDSLLAFDHAVRDSLKLTMESENENNLVLLAELLSEVKNRKLQFSPVLQSVLRSTQLKEICSRQSRLSEILDTMGLGK